MFGRSKSEQVRANAAAAADLAAQLAADKRFRKKLLAAAGHGRRAKRRAQRNLGILALARRLAGDEQLRTELSRMAHDLEGALDRLQKKRRHRVRKSMLLVAGAGGAAAVALPQSRRWITDQVEGRGGKAGDDTGFPTGDAGA